MPDPSGRQNKVGSLSSVNASLWLLRPDMTGHTIQRSSVSSPWVTSKIGFLLIL